MLSVLQLLVNRICKTSKKFHFRPASEGTRLNKEPLLRSLLSCSVVLLSQSFVWCRCRIHDRISLNLSIWKVWKYTQEKKVYKVIYIDSFLTHFRGIIAYAIVYYYLFVDLFFVRNIFYVQNFSFLKEILNGHISVYFLFIFQ